MKKSVVVQGIMTTYNIVGNGDVLVFLHGWGDAQTTFDRLMNELKANYTCVSLDLPGFGSSEKPKRTFDLQAYAEYVKDFLNKIQIDDIYAFVGHSNGGAIAMKGLSSRALESERLVLLASSGVRNPASKRNFVLRMLAKSAKQFVKVLPKRLQDKIKRRAYKAIGSDVFVAEDMRSTFEKVVAEDLGIQAKSVTQHTLLLYGDMDNVTPVAYGEYFVGRIKKAKLKIILNAGHFLHHDQPDKVLKEVQDFLK